MFSRIIPLWKKSLENILAFYDIYRPLYSYFIPKLFLFFIVTNVACYWLGIWTAFPFLMFSHKAYEYILLQFPVGLMGALFDTVSFFITIYIARKAVSATKTSTFLLHLSVDIVMAFLATMWVVLVFITSGWILSVLTGQPEDLSSRSNIYHGRLLQALLHPFQNIRNIYFGLIMGISAALPTFVHLFLFMKSSWHAWRMSQNREEVLSPEIKDTEVSEIMSE